jgi:hypothetical protein
MATPGELGEHCVACVNFQLQGVAAVREGFAQQEAGSGKRDQRILAEVDQVASGSSTASIVGRPLPAFRRYELIYRLSAPVPD